MSKQSAITLDKHLALDKAQVKAAIDVVKDRKHPMLMDPRVQARGKLRKKLGKELRPLFAGAGLDLGKLDKALQVNHAELRKSLAADRAANAKQVAQAHKLRLAGLANTRAALEQIAGIPHLTTAIPLATPFFILAVIAEIVAGRLFQARANYEARDTATSLLMGLGSTVVGIPGKVVRSRYATDEPLEHGQLPDPEGQAIADLTRRVAELEEQLKALTDAHLLANKSSGNR